MYYRSTKENKKKKKNKKRIEFESKATFMQFRQKRNKIMDENFRRPLCLINE
jgi:hypothetical protein